MRSTKFTSVLQELPFPGPGFLDILRNTVDCRPLSRFNLAPSENHWHGWTQRHNTIFGTLTGGLLQTLKRGQAVSLTGLGGHAQKSAVKILASAGNKLKDEDARTTVGFFPRALAITEAENEERRQLGKVPEEAMAAFKFLFTSVHLRKATPWSRSSKTDHVIQVHKEFCDARKLEHQIFRKLSLLRPLKFVDYRSTFEVNLGNPEATMAQVVDQMVEKPWAHSHILETRNYGEPLVIKLVGADSMKAVALALTRVGWHLQEDWAGTGLPPPFPFVCVPLFQELNSLQGHSYLGLEIQVIPLA